MSRYQEGKRGRAHSLWVTEAKTAPKTAGRAVDTHRSRSPLRQPWLWVLLWDREGLGTSSVSQPCLCHTDPGTLCQHLGHRHGFEKGSF